MVCWVLVPHWLVWVFQKLLICLNIPAQTSVWFTESNPKKRKYAVPLKWQWVSCTRVSRVTRSQPNSAPLECSGTWDLHHGCGIDRYAAVVWSIQVNIDHKYLRNVSITFLNLHKELNQLWRRKGLQSSTSIVYLIKWPVSVYLLVKC